MSAAVWIIVAIVVVIVLALIGVGIWLYLRNRNRPPMPEFEPTPSVSAPSVPAASQPSAPAAPQYSSPFAGEGSIFVGSGFANVPPIIEPFKPPVTDDKLFTSLATNAKLSLKQGEGLQSVTGNYKAYVDNFGNLAIYPRGQDLPSWQTNTTGTGKQPFQLLIQQSGRVSIYDRDNVEIWYMEPIRTGAGSPYKLTLTTGGALVVTDRNGDLVSKSNPATYVDRMDTSNIVGPNILYVGDAIQSNNGRFRLVFGRDENAGDLAIRLYDGGKEISFPVFTYLAGLNASTANSIKKGKVGKPYRLQLQDNGNLVVYNSNNVNIGDTGRHGSGRLILVMQDDRNAVLYPADANGQQSGKAKWSSDTHI